MEENKDTEILVKEENKQEAENFMQFMKGLKEEEQKEFSYLLKGVKIGMGMAKDGRTA
jgi:hypothetical protein